MFLLPQYFTLLLIGMAATLTAFGQQRNLCADEQAYDFQTKLKGGYRIVFRTDTEFKYLDLWRANRRITELTSSSCGLLHKNLGYVGADFTNYFVLVHSFGSGNPHDVELIRKRDGKDMFAGHKEACWIDANEKYSIFLFSYDCVPDRADKIVLMNITTKKKRYLDFPAFIFSDPMILGRIEIASVSRRVLALRFRSFNGPQSVIRRYKL